MFLFKKLDILIPSVSCFRNSVKSAYLINRRHFLTGPKNAWNHKLGTPRCNSIKVRHFKIAEFSTKSGAHEVKSTAEKVWNTLVGGAAMVGLGTSVYVGLFLDVPIAVKWSDVARSNMRDTYMYFGGGMVFTASSALAIARNPRLTQIIGGRGWLSLLGTVAIAFTSGYACHSLPYEKGLSSKKLLWVLHNLLLGSFVAPLSVLGGPVMLHAAFYGTVVVWGLSLQGLWAQNDVMFLGTGAVSMVSSFVGSTVVGSHFLPKLPYSGLRYAMVNGSLLVGVYFFAGFLLYETTKIVNRIKYFHSTEEQHYDPINSSIRIYINAVHVMIHICKILIQEDR